MTTFRVSELEGALLDAAVAKADPALRDEWALNEPDGSGRSFAPSSKWDQGGPIIGRERICFLCSTMLLPEAEPQHWVAKRAADWHKDTRGEGPTQLIAAMRAYVASKFGETVDLP